ncbi:cytochrome (ubi)quinol oxidase subunit III [Alicyclobacillus sendaiensis PA2]|uniref:Cytochrome (Ubi)quinol oxidase subunit III n=2 Tax=Alicyclobacillus sendaiensis TaxID=192387 RepID=A0ABT6XZC2_ALISE|nr:cytochrome (ubi)quinol oxidase subunit III [Alicyclobacillus sendaiensis]MDI9260438.1 cytochrome (ubi)quinol oxidase subunit III [Alicyclobacillus sendaiensis PA2]
MATRAHAMGEPRDGGTRALALEYTHAEDRTRILGFWIFLATDMILFGCLFATYLVLRTHMDGGPTPATLFDMKGFGAETLALLTSSFTGGLATLSMRDGRQKSVAFWMSVTIVLGLTFLGIEASEFAHDAFIGAVWQRSAFLSSFFTLVGTHGCHVTFGVLWMLVTLYQVLRRGLTPRTARKVFVVNLYWHFLDVVWIFIFTVVYLTGMVM